MQNLFIKITLACFLRIASGRIKEDDRLRLTSKAGREVKYGTEEAPVETVIIVGKASS